MIVSAPVVLTGAADRVMEEFPRAVSAKFEFVFLAEDDERTEQGWVQPGIGGEIYRLLGLGTKADAGRYRPEILDERRELLHL